MKYLSNKTYQVFLYFDQYRLVHYLSFWKSICILAVAVSYGMNWNQKPVLRRQKWVPKIEKKIYVSHTTYLQKRVQLKCISHKSNASRKMSTNFSFTFKTPDTLLSHYKKTCLATVELLYWIRLCLIIRLISIKWYIVWNRKIIFALKWHRIAVFCHKYFQKCTNRI